MITYETSNENTESSTIGGNNQVSKAGFVYAESTNGLNNKNVIMDADDARSFVNENDGVVLSNIVFKKPDTVAVPILVTRLQAGAGLISIGSIVDIYSLSDPNSQSQSSDSSSPSVSNDSNSIDSDVNSNNGNNSDNNSNGVSHDGSTNSQSSSKTFSNSPDISGSTILAIMRSKDSGVISADYIKSQTKINGNDTNQVENSKSFSTDVEEMIRGSISGGYDEKQISSLLDSYGLKLSDYERQSNLAELDVQYLLLIEVPREDVPYVINNMENVILTIPTSDAPNWMVNELKATYLKT